MSASATEVLDTQTQPATENSEAITTEETTATSPSEFAKLSKMETENYQLKKIISDFKKEKTSFSEREETLKADPLKALETYGHTYDSLVDTVLKTKDNTNDKGDFDLEEYTKNIKEEILKEVNQNNQQSEEQKQIDLNISNFKNDLSELVKTKSEEFPALNFSGETDLIFNIINEDFERKVANFGREQAKNMVMDKLEAAKMAEKFLDERIGTMLQSEPARKYLLNKLENKGDSQSSETLKPSFETLTNSQAAAGSTETKPAVFDADVNMKRAIAKLRHDE